MVKKIMTKRFVERKDKKSQKAVNDGGLTCLTFKFSAVSRLMITEY